MPVTSHSKSKNFLIYWFPLILYCLAIFIQSGGPGPEKIPDVRFLDKFMHFFAYGLLGVLFYRAYETLPLKKFKNLLIFISIASATLFGISDEIHQYYVPARHADLMDVIANAIGSVCGVYLYSRWKNRKIPV